MPHLLLSARWRKYWIFARLSQKIFIQYSFCSSIGYCFLLYLVLCSISSCCKCCKLQSRWEIWARLFDPNNSQLVNENKHKHTLLKFIEHAAYAKPRANRRTQVSSLKIHTCAHAYRRNYSRCRLCIHRTSHAHTGVMMLHKSVGRQRRGGIGSLCFRPQHVHSTISTFVAVMSAILTALETPRPVQHHK